MQQHSLKGKMALIGAIFLAPVALLVALLYLQIQRDVEFYRSERIGVTYTKALRPLLGDLEALRISESTSALSPSQSRRVEADFHSARHMDATTGSDLLLSATLADLERKFQATRRADTTLDDLITLLGLVSDNSKITLDPILDGYYVGDTMVNKLPSLIDGMAKIDAIAVRSPTNLSLPANLLELTLLSGQLDTATAAIDHNLTIALRAAPYLAPAFTTPRAQERSSTSAVIKLLAAALRSPQQPGPSFSNISHDRIATFRTAVALYDASIDGMADVLDRRLAALRLHEVTVFSIVFLAVVTAAILMIATTRSMSHNIAQKIALEHEIVGRKEMQERLAYAAFHDELTGLANRALLMDRLNHFVAQRHPPDRIWAMLFIDLDRFKVINDNLGHRAGDLVLIEASRRLERCVRAGDTLARLGGDEFVVVLDDLADVHVATLLAQRILHSFETPFIVAGHEIFSSASIGIATSRVSADSPEDVLRNADIAMYRAKQLGKQRYEIFSEDLLTTSVLRLELETDLARALERGELCLFYQPLVSMHENRLSGFEALVRWRHPRRGLVAPDDFVPLAEENGMIVPIGEWVFHEACRQFQEWRQAFAGASALRININVSAKQLLSPNFVDMVKHALAASHLSADCVNVEITETVLMENAEQGRIILLQLRELGVHIHLDDFGTGYSSLAYLRELPIDSIKIDRSFVSAATDTATSGLASVEIVQTIIALAQSLALTTTAEGTETLVQVDALRGLGCTNAQGYYFSRPVDGTAAASIIKQAGAGLDLTREPVLR